MKTDFRIGRDDRLESFIESPFINAIPGSDASSRYIVKEGGAD
jgi:hypothetical protein